VSEDRLDSWKEIAAYLKRDVTTVQRWEKREAMPVHRHVHDKLGSVYAFRSELDSWSRSRHADDESPVPPPASPPPPQNRIALTWFLVAAALLLAIGAGWWALERQEYFWRNPLDGARFQRLTDFNGREEAAAVSRDGRFVAFLSDRDGQMDVWVTQVGTGQFYNLTQGSVRELINPSIRTMGFSPDGSLVTFWTRNATASGGSEINLWAVPTLGGKPRPYLEGIAEFDWSRDGSRLTYHTPGPGDPMFVREPGRDATDRAIYTAASGLHAHFPLWSPDQRFIYFVQGSVPDAMDVWRIGPQGVGAEQVTHHSGRVSHPVMIDSRTLMYLASSEDGSGPWLYSLDVERRIPHRVGTGVDRYTSLASSDDGRRLVLTLANPKGTFWRVPVTAAHADTSQLTPVSLTTGPGFSPRIGPGYLLYVSSKGMGDGIWKLADGEAAELWSSPDARIVGSPSIEPRTQRIAFSVERHGQTQLYVMNADGTNARALSSSLKLRGDPAWTPDGQSISAAADVDGSPRLFTISLDGTATSFAQDYAVDPVWAPGGEFVLFSGPDIGTTFSVKAATRNGAHPLPDLTLTRGARRLRFLDGSDSLVVMRGSIQHKDLWLINLKTGTERQLTELPPDFTLRDFDVSPDGREIVLERVQDDSDVVLLELN
jgi:Tol biopolymer transport system component